jgi:hypothetical protein
LSEGAARFAARHPRVWHVIEAEGAGAWLMQTGLLPAIEMLADGANRDDFRCFDLGAGRSAMLRPQQMPDHRLLPTLAGAVSGRPARWWRHIDNHVSC